MVADLLVYRSVVKLKLDQKSFLNLNLFVDLKMKGGTENAIFRHCESSSVLFTLFKDFLKISSLASPIPHESLEHQNSFVSQISIKCLM